MRILWVKSGGFLPLDTGGKIRSFHLAHELSRRHEVSIFTFYPSVTPDPHQNLLNGFYETECLPLDLPERASLRNVLAYAANCTTRRPFQVVHYCRPEVARRLRERLSRNRYDLVICDFVLTAGVLPWDLHIPTVIFSHNVEATLWRRHLALNKNVLWKLVALREHRSIDRFERHFTRLADHVLTVSDSDRREFLKFLDPDNVSTIPTGVDLNYFRPRTNVQHEPSVIFTGSMDWKPNEDAIRYFVASIFPLVQKQVPDVVLRIVGRKPGPGILAFKEKNCAIQVTGTVEDVRPYVHDSSVYIVPLRIGSGTRIKIFEAMAMGVPVVSTSIGAEGLPVQHNKNILLADSPSEFADQTLQLLLQPSLRQRISQEARTLVERSYSWTAAAEAFDRVLDKIVQPNRRVKVNA